VTFAEYRGLTVKEIGKIRRAVRKNQGAVAVAKKTLLKLAAKNTLNLELPDENIEGAVFAAFSSADPIAIPKLISDFTKEFEKLKITGGIMENKILSASQVKALALIPSKEILLAKLLGLLQSPITGFVRVLHANLQGLHTVLSAIRDKAGKQ
jgi:large subunit ribosomal protein L10